MSKLVHSVGIVGLEPGRSWAARSHVPALRAMAEHFRIVGIANSTRESAEKAAAAMGIPQAFDDVAAMVRSPDIDVVAVTVKVQHHSEIVRQAIDAGKNVYCEWPLGNGLAEAEDMARMAASRGIVAVCGTQACLAPEIQYLKRLVASGYVGEVLSTTLVARGGGWGGVIPQARNNAYLLDPAGGATMLTIPVGHAIAALREVFGDVAEVASVLATRRGMALVADTGDRIPVTAPDQVLVSGMFSSGVPMSIHYRGGMPRDGKGLLWEINGTKGDLRLSGPFGHLQLAPLHLEGAQSDDREFRPMAVPPEYLAEQPADPTIGNVARTYVRMADDLAHGTRTAPSFAAAVAVHRVIAAIEAAAARGTHVEP